MDTSPHKSGFIDVKGVRLHYLDWGGSGPALLFLAGVGNNAHIFDGFAPRFTDQFHVLALTRRGHGESDCPETGYDLDTLTDDIKHFMDCLKIDRAILVQHTNEGLELPHFAFRYPERVDKLVFLEPVWDRKALKFKAMMDAWQKIDQEVAYPDDPCDSLQAYVDHMTRTFPAYASSWCEARLEDLRLIELYYTYQLPWFQDCLEQFQHALPHAKVVELPHSHTYFFITQAESVYHEMNRFFFSR